MKEGVNLDKQQYWKKLKGEQLANFLGDILDGKGIYSGNVAFVCIGTDRSSGDALGPLVGTYLQEAGYPKVIGTLEYPCDACNLIERLQEIEPDDIVIAVDACLGQQLSVGLYQVSNGPLLPGKSVGKVLPQVGDYTIAAIVNADGPKQYAILQTTSLYKVMSMAREITEAIQRTIPLE